MKNVSLICEIPEGNILMESLALLIKTNLKNDDLSLYHFENAEPLLFNKSFREELVVIYYEKQAAKALSLLRLIKLGSLSSQVIIINKNNLDLKAVKEFKNFTNVILFNANSSSEEFFTLLSNFDDSKLLLCKINQSILLDNIINEESAHYTSKFSKVEANILDCADKGYSIVETAEALQISTNTVAAYRSKILKKMGASSILQAVTMMRNETDN